jgi:hypothetical protein
MTTKTEEEIIVEQLSKVCVYLNRRDERTLQVTCMRKILGGGGIARSYPSEQDAKKTLLALGIKEELIDAGLATLREINRGGIKPDKLVPLVEFPIPSDVLLATGFAV